MDDVEKSVNESDQFLQLWNDDSVRTDQLLKFFIKKSQVGILVTDKYGRIILVNPAIGEALHQTLPLGSDLSRIEKFLVYHSEDTSNESPSLKLSQAIVAGKAITDIEMTFSLQDNQRRDFLVNATPILSNDEKILGAVVILQDITENNRTQKITDQNIKKMENNEKKYKDDLLSYQEKFSILFENSVFGIAFLDKKGTIITNNQKLNNMLGYSEGELEGLSFINLFPSRRGKNLNDIFQLLTSGKVTVYQVEKFFHHQNGEAHRFEITFSITNEYSRDDGDPWFVLVIVNEVTEIFALQENLRKADKVDIIDRLGITLAHEINNPLQSSIGCLGIAGEILDSENEAHRFLQIALEELERVVNLVKHLQDLGYKHDLQKMQFVNLNTLLKKTTTLTRKQAQNAKVKIDWKPVANLLLVPEIPGLLIQVFTNLVLNAIEAMPNGGRIRIHTDPTNQPEGVNISFSDNGIGIEPERLPHIFEPFHSTQNVGFGLGLYICQKNVEEHGGRIEVESKVGVGTTFTIWLPGKQPPPTLRSVDV